MRRILAVFAVLMLVAQPATAHHAAYQAANDARVTTLENRVAALEADLAELTDRVTEIEEQLSIPAPTPSPTPTPAPTPTPPPTVGMWGGITGWSLANTRNGDGMTHLAWSFVAEKSLAVLTMRAYFQGSAGYAEGNGGIYDFYIVPDSGGNPNLGATKLGFADNVGSFPGVASVPTNTPGKVITFANTSALTAGTRYWVVMQNVDASPNSNNTSANAMYQNQGTPRFWRYQPQLLWQMQYTLNGGSSWTIRNGYAMIAQLNYSSGYAQGQPYMELSYPTIPSRVGDIDGTRLIRQPFVVSAPTTVTAVGIAMQKAGGSTGSVTIAIRDNASGRGALVASLVKTAGSWPDGSMAGDDTGGSKAWAGGAVSTVLQPGTYRLEFSESGGGRYMAWPIRHGALAGYGYSTAIDAAFPGGLAAQYSTDGGSSWTNFDGSDDQLPAYIEWTN